MACEAKSRLSLPRRFRLTRRTGFSLILQQKARTKDWFAVHALQNDIGCARLGITVGKRLVPTAVQRNSIKRMIRECFRLYARQGMGNDVVVRLRRPLAMHDRTAARTLLCEMFQLALSK